MLLPTKRGYNAATFGNVNTAVRLWGCLPFKHLVALDPSCPSSPLYLALHCSVGTAGPTCRSPSPPPGIPRVASFLSHRCRLSWGVHYMLQIVEGNAFSGISPRNRSL